MGPSASGSAGWELRRTDRYVEDLGWEGLIGLVHYRGANAIHPAAPILAARRGEGGAAYLLGVQAERVFLGRVLANREAVRQGLGGEFISGNH